MRITVVLSICLGLSLANELLGPGEMACRGTEPLKWPIELQVGRFQLHADFDVSTASDLPPELAKLAEDVSQLLGLEVGVQPVHVVLFATENEYRRYMRNYFPQLPQRRALFIQDRGPGMLFAHWHPDIASDLRHEITHALLNDAPQPLPLWLDEGLAEYFEVERQRRFGGNDYLVEVNQRAAVGLVPSMKELEAVRQLQDFKEPHYRDSWAWVHFLLHRSSATRQVLIRYLAEHRSGTEPLALSRQLPDISADVTSEFISHFHELLPSDGGHAN